MSVFPPNSFPSPAELYAAGKIPWNEYLKHQAMLDTFTSMEERPKVLTLAEARKLPSFQRRLAELSRHPAIPMSGRPQGRQYSGPPRVSTSRSTRGSPDDDDPSEPESHPLERPVDRLLFALRQFTDDAYRVIPDSNRWAWMARCPCNPDEGHTMLLMDMGDDRMPGIACRHGCNSGDIRRWFGIHTPEEEELRQSLAVYPEEFWPYRGWRTERGSS